MLGSCVSNKAMARGMSRRAWPLVLHRPLKFVHRNSRSPGPMPHGLDFLLACPCGAWPYRRLLFFQQTMACIAHPLLNVLLCANSSLHVPQKIGANAVLDANGLLDRWEIQSSPRRTPIADRQRLPHSQRKLDQMDAKSSRTATSVTRASA